MARVAIIGCDHGRTAFEEGLLAAARHEVVVGCARTEDEVTAGNRPPNVVNPEEFEPRAVHAP